MKAPVDSVCKACAGVGFLDAMQPNVLCAECEGFGGSLTPREKRLAEALNELLPLADDQRPWDAAWLKAFAIALCKSEQALLAAGYTEEKE